MKKISALIVVFVMLGSLLSCGPKGGSGRMYKSNAEVSYYADKFNGKKTASGETFSNSKLTAAHRSFAFGTRLRVTNRANDKSVIVEVNDRGPHKKSRELDLSKRAFMEITDNKNHGSIRVSIEVLR